MIRSFAIALAVLATAAQAVPPVIQPPTPVTGIPSGNWDSHVATWCPEGKYALKPLTTTTLTPVGTDNTTTGVHYGIRVGAPVPDFDAIRVIIPNIATTPVTGVQVKARVATQDAGTNSNTTITTIRYAANPATSVVAAGAQTFTAAGNGTTVTFGGGKTEVDIPASTLAPAGQVTIPGYAVSDWFYIKSVPRIAETSGQGIGVTGSQPLLFLELTFPPSTYTPASGATASYPGITYWTGGGTGTDGGDLSYIDTTTWTARAAFQVTSGGPANGQNRGVYLKAVAEQQTTFASTSQYQGSNTPLLVLPPAFYVQFHTTKTVHQMVVLGDSTDTTAYVGGLSFETKSAIGAADATGSLIPVCSLSQPSATTAQYALMAEPLMPYLKPEILWFKPIGPNDMVSLKWSNTGAPTDGYHQALQMYGVAKIFAEKYRSKLIVSPFLAINYANLQAGAADANRIAFNNLLKTDAAANGFVYADIDGAWSNNCASVSNGQCQPVASFTPDGTHVNDAGQTAIADGGGRAAIIQAVAKP